MLKEKLKRVGAYLLARLQEPGTLRSLVVVLIGLHQGARAEDMTDSLVALAMVALGAVSALRAESK